MIELGGLAPAERAKLLQRAESDLSAYIEKVRPVIEAVRTEGDEALARFAREFDKAPLTADAIAATKADFDKAFDQVDRKVVGAIEFAIDGIRRFHEAQKPEEMWLKEIRPGVFAGERDDPHRLGRLLRPARQGRLSQRGHDDGGARGRRRGAADRCPHPVRAGRQGRCGEPDRRAAGRRGAGL